jgi:Na+/melibiose symporter-like transporter
MILQGILFGMSWLTLGVILFFFLWGLSDGTVSADNILLWVILVAAPSAILWGATALRAKGRRGAAMGLASLLAVPAVLAGIVILVLIIAPPRWH